MQVPMKSVANRITELNHVAGTAVPDAAGPRNQRGESATKTPEEAITRLQEKATRNQGRANRERIQVRISENAVRESDHDGSVMKSSAVHA
jgi:hypothetical protein